MQHISFNHCTKRVGGEDIDDNFHNRRSCFRSYFQAFSGHVQTSTGFYQYAKRNTESNCECGGEQVKSYGFEADATKFFNVAQATNTHNKRGEYQRYDNHLDKIHKDGTQRSNPSLSKCSAFCAQLQTGNNTET